MPHQVTIPSKLPDVGTTIFSVVSQWANDYDAVNLGQGFPDFECDPKLIHAVHGAMLSGHNQYAPMSGVALLRERIVEKTEQLYGVHYHPADEVTVTLGATEALFSAILAVVQEGDEVIVLPPCYDSYIPAIRLAGGKARSVPLTEDFQVDIPGIKNAINERTRMIVLNTPHNPTGRIWSDDDWKALADILRDTNIIVLSDEVYEHMVYDEKRHFCAAQYPELFDRSFVVASFGKTFHVTGWRMGYVLAPKPLMDEFRRVHQFNAFTISTPTQIGIAEYLKDASTYSTLPEFFQPRRDLLINGLSEIGFIPKACEGTYFLVTDTKSIASFNGMNDMAICEFLTKKIGVAAIPISAFYPPDVKSPPQSFIRFCFAKKIETIEMALSKLQKLKTC